jgi:copper chaperone NosL
MRRILSRATRVLDAPIDLAPRAIMTAAAVLMLTIYVVPLWNLTMFAPQYPQGLRLDIHSYKLESGNEGQDLKEINVLNHYIGMRDLAVEDFTEFKWMPFVVGAIALLVLRAVVHGKFAHLVDVLVIFTYFAAFSMWSFANKLWWYGHNLSPSAAVKVEPFMPPLFGYKQLANFEVYSYPAVGSYALGGAMLLLIAAAVVAWLQFRREQPEYLARPA